MNKLNPGYYFRRYAFFYFLTVLNITASVILDMLAPVIVQHIVDDVIIAKNIKLLKFLLLGILGIGFGKCGFQNSKEFLCDWCGSKIARNIRINLFVKIQSLSANFFDGINSGELMSRVKDDVDNIWNVTAFMGILIIEVILRVVTTMYFMIRINLFLTIIPCVAMIVTAFIAIKMEKKLDNLYEHTAQENSELNNSAA